VRVVRANFETWRDVVSSLNPGLEVVHNRPDHPSFEGLVDAGFRVAPLGEELPPEGVLFLVPSALDELRQLVDRLLGPGGCPWDQEQTHESLKRCLLEEAYEVLEAIDGGDPAALREELGDLLLQPLMHAQMEALEGRFDADEVAKGILAKLVHRHPHVFAGLEVASSEEVLRNWEAIKATEKQERTSRLDGVPRHAPSLLRAHQISRKAAKAGFEWPDLDGVWEKLQEEEAELRDAIAQGDAQAIESEIGDLLFTVVQLARWTSVEPEDALRIMLDRFERRFRAMESATDRPLEQLSPSQWDGLWNEAKRQLS